MRKEEGITLVALIITIIVLLILAGISLGALTSNNSILLTSREGKINAEISQEKEIVSISTVKAIGKNKYNNYNKQQLQIEVNNQIGSEDKAIVFEDKSDFYVYFTETARYYKVDKNGNVENIEPDRAKDDFPGDITKDAKGNTLDGSSEDTAYQINCIEDLCAFSNSNNYGQNSFRGKYVKLMRDLDFESDFSYINGYIANTGDITSCNNIEELKDKLTNRNGRGFYAIGEIKYANTYFRGNFNGNYHTISNLYEKYDDMEAGFMARTWGATIKNITVTGNVTGNNAGGIVSYGRGCRLYNCTSYVNVTTVGNEAGGIVGQSYAEGNYLVNCMSYGNIKGGSRNAGIYGFDFSNGDKIYNCINAGEAKNAFTALLIGSNNIINCLNYGKCSGYYSGTATHCYKLIGSTSGTEGEEESYIKSQEFVNEMNHYIETTDVDPTIGWAKWVYRENEYPTIDVKTIWSGTEWVTAE